MDQGNARRHAWVESKASQEIQNIRDKYNSSVSKHPIPVDRTNEISNNENISSKDLFFKRTRNITPISLNKDKHINVEKVTCNKSDRSYSLSHDPIYDDPLVGIPTERNLLEVKRKLASNVSDIEQTLKEYTDRRSWMKRSISFTNGMTSEKDCAERQENKRAFLKRGKSHSDIFVQNTNVDRNTSRNFRRGHSLPYDFSSPKPASLLSDPLERIRARFISELPWNELRSQSARELYRFDQKEPNDTLLSSENVNTSSPKWKGNLPRKKKKYKAKKKLPQDSIGPMNSGMAPSPPPSPIYAELRRREEYRRIEAKKREQRMINNRKRREQLEKERMDRIQENSTEARQGKHREMAILQKKKTKLTQILLISVVFGARVDKMCRIITTRRHRIRNFSTRNQAAGLITRKLRHYCFRCNRKRVRGAIQILGAVFVLKVRIWRDRRRDRAADVLQGFLYALKSTGAFLGILTRGKMWRAYKEKTIKVQKLWRTKWIIMKAQILVIDQQWKKKQERNIFKQVDRIYKKNENETSDTPTTRGIKNTKIKTLQRKKSIYRKLMEKSEYDILNNGHITPFEIRMGMIRQTLKYMKKHFMNDMERYNTDLNHYKAEIKRRQRAGTLIKNSSMNHPNAMVEIKKKNAHVHTRRQKHRHRQLSFLQSKEPSSTIIFPKRPLFRLVLRDKSLQLLMDLADKHVEKMRIAWDPYNMNTDIPDYEHVGKEVALLHYSEIDGYQKCMK